MTTRSRPTISGATENRAGMLMESTVPLKSPNQMKCQKVTSPACTIVASTAVAAVLSNCETTMIDFLRIRSAMTPPASEKRKDGSMNDNMTQVRASGELVMS